MPITYDRKAVYDAVRAQVFSGQLYQNQVEGIDSILAEWERLQPSGDPRFVAYMLATAAWETAYTMRPVEEYGHGRGRAYGVPAGPWHQVYDGRGDVQLTWLRNYQHATTRLRAIGALSADEDLAKTPALAMRPDVAAAIMFYGMIEGWFTGKKLADYFHDARSDWIDARRIINGLDQATTIASYGERFFAGLKAGSVDAPVAAHPAPTPIEVAPPAAEVAATPAQPITVAVATPAPSPAPGILSRITSFFVG